MQKLKCIDRVGIKYIDVEYIIITEIKNLIKSLLKNEDNFIQYVTNITKTNSKLFQETQKQKFKNEIDALNKRIGELENLIQKLFENKVTADIPDAVFHKMMNQYRKELEEKEKKTSRN